MSHLKDYYTDIEVKTEDSCYNDGTLKSEIILRSYKHLEKSIIQDVIWANNAPIPAIEIQNLILDQKMAKAMVNLLNFFINQGSLPVVDSKEIKEFKKEVLENE